MVNVSCIILSNLNDSFVKERTIPSIIKNSKSHSIEIIVVDNSPTQDFKYDNIKVIYTEPYHIPKAYNKGVLEAKGKYVALFHDDCELLDDKWINKLSSELNDNVYLVSPEMERGHSSTSKKEYFLKEVPSMMEKKKFIEIGGYDETSYFGYEDLLLAKNIYKKNKKIKQVPIKYAHYRGMSSLLIGLPPYIMNELKDNFLKLNLKDYFKIKDKIWKEKFKLTYNILLEYNKAEHNTDIIEIMPKTKEDLNFYLNKIQETYGKREQIF
jgi:glycosyltransferase involved in cell wall biosynthesis